MKPCALHGRQDFVADRAVEHACACAASTRNRKGSDGTMVSGTKLLNGATLTRTMSSPPILVCSIVSFSEPSAPLANTLTLCLPPVRSPISLPMYMTASTVG